MHTEQAPPKELVLVDSADKTILQRQALEASASESSAPAALHFIELFAGEGVLAKVMLYLGVSCEPPNDLANGGTDFGSRLQVEQLKSSLRLLCTEGKKLIVHLAPFCSTFSRARDRSSETKLRSSSHPAGLPTLSKEHRGIANEANAIAEHAVSIAVWAATSLDAVVCVENPAGSYLWPFVDGQSTMGRTSFEDAVVSQCLYGAPYRKDTRFRSWNASALGLQHRCAKSAKGHTCGAIRHTALEFSGLPTGPGPAH